MHDNVSFSDAAQAHPFNDKFVEVRSSLPRLSWTPVPMFHISIKETEKAMLATKLHSSAGHDEIAAWFLGENACALCRLLCSIFNASVQEASSRHFGSQQTLSPCQRPLQRLTLFRLEGGGGLFMPAPTLNSSKFQTI